MLALLVIGTAGSAPLIGTADEWAPLRAGLDAWSALSFGANFSVAVGDENGTRFRWASPGFSTSHTLMAGASLSKWPAAIMISGLVNDGILSYEDRASKYLPWWTTAWNDTRSAMTLGHLLSFTSGFTRDGMCAHSPSTSSSQGCGTERVRSRACMRAYHSRDRLPRAQGLATLLDLPPLR